MEYFRAKLTRTLIDFFGEDDRRIEHALRVLYHAERIAEAHAAADSDILIAAALLHDVGIKLSEERHGFNNGETQERYGPPVAERLLQAVGFPADKIEIVTRIIGNHHSPSRYGYPELAILKQADGIVNTREKI